MQQRNWRFLFISLLSLNVFIIITLFILIFSPTPGSNALPEKEYIEDEAGAEFTVRSSKQNLTELVNQYIDKALNDEDGKYSIQLNENVQIFGSVEAFEKDIPISIEMEPVVQENGDIILKQTEMSLGLLNLPKNKILEYVAKAIDAPEWVIIDPDNEEIYIAITQMDIKSNFKVRAQQIDLENDQISFRIKVPTATLGL
ncbi:MULTISPECIES: YpmS family protein [Paraliobacillus]|uniref:YpmS family protein n=1 Tax=Paraliobacillus TaxID=200903 RepID=UPI000DD349A2|nr:MULTISPECIES: YpmS family protein [Paraliobacillus]